jgi:hypothetical protein
MNKWRCFCLGFAVLLVSLIAMAQEQGVVRPQLLLSEIVQGMPKGERQEVPFSRLASNHAIRRCSIHTVSR